MDKHLKELDFEKNIKTKFTEKNKENVLNRIHQGDQNPSIKPKRHYFQNALTIVFAVGLLFLSFTLISYDGSKEQAGEMHDLNKNSNNQDTVTGMEAGKGEDENKARRKLVVGGEFILWDPETLKYYDYKTDTYTDYDYLDSNYNLYVAHLRAALITDNAIFMSYKTINHTLFKRYLDSILFFLNIVDYGEERADEFKLAIQLIEKAIQQNVEKGDPILDEIHMLLHELDEYYNAEPVRDHHTTQNGLKFPEVE